MSDQKLQKWWLHIQQLGFHFYSQLQIWHDFPVSTVEALDPRFIEPLGRKNPKDHLVQLVNSQLDVITPLSDTHYASTSMSLPNKKDIEEGDSHEWHAYCVSDPWLGILHTLYNLFIKKGFFHKCRNWGLERFVQSYIVCDWASIHIQVFPWCLTATSNLVCLEISRYKELTYSRGI